MSQGDRLVRLLETSSVVQGWTEGPDPAWGGGEGEAGKSKSREGLKFLFSITVDRIILY